MGPRGFLGSLKEEGGTQGNLRWLTVVSRSFRCPSEAFQGNLRALHEGLMIFERRLMRFTGYFRGIQELQDRT